MSSQSLPHVTAAAGPPVYTLTVFIRRRGDEVIARAGNLELPEVTGATVREALKQIVSSAKSRLEENKDVEWKSAEANPLESESQFRVPIHL